MTTTSNAQNVGILAIDIYFPNQYVEQSELESYDGVSSGKYTIGLGQHQMGFCTEAQDIYSLSLSAVQRFMTVNNIDYASIGRLEVGTETILDHSKSIKSVLMQLFMDSGNTDIEGIDCINACYGGTNALFSSLNWLESSAYDGRNALVVCGDIAEYAAGPARPTGGAGIVVMLLGHNAPLVVDQKVRASHMEHTYDFYKPHLSSPFPVVDGALSQTCYLSSLDACYQRFVEKYTRVNGKPFVFAPNRTQQQQQEGQEQQQEQEQQQYWVFHAPYNKLVQKSFARLFYLDALLSPSTPTSQLTLDTLQSTNCAHFPSTPSVLPVNRADPAYQLSLTDRNLEKQLSILSSSHYTTHVVPSIQLPQRLGNLYTASLYAGVLSLISERGENLAGTQLMLFSYGSGLAASMFSITVHDTPSTRQQLQKIKEKSNVFERLDQRVKQTPLMLNNTLSKREAHYGQDAVNGYQIDVEDDASIVNVLQDGEYYLIEKDAKGKRVYNIHHTTTTQE